MEIEEMFTVIFSSDFTDVLALKPQVLSPFKIVRWHKFCPDGDTEAKCCVHYPRLSQ